MTLHFRDRRDAASPRYRDRAEITVLTSEQKPLDLLQVDLIRLAQVEFQYMTEVAQRPSERRSLEVDLFPLNGVEPYYKFTREKMIDI